MKINKREFVPECDMFLKREDQFRIIYRELNIFERYLIQLWFKFNKGRPLAFLYKLVKRIIIDWEGLYDEKGNKVPYSKENLGLIPSRIIHEFTTEYYYRDV